MGQVTLEIRENIGYVTIEDLASRNALSLEMRECLGEIMEQLAADAAIRVVVLQGAGEHFVSGGDVKSFYARVTSQSKAQLRAEFLERTQNLNRLILTMRRMPQPIIAKVQGAAAGVGVSLALATDLVLCGEEAFFILGYGHVGLTPDGGASYHLTRLAGCKKAMEWLLLGERIPARAALEHGLVNAVMASDRLDDAVTSWAQRLANGPGAALAQSKKLIYAASEQALAAQLRLESESFADAVGRSEFEEGVRAFYEKRRPQFDGSARFV